LKGYKFIQANMTSKNGEAKWKLKEWKKFDGNLVMCSSGLHASPTPLTSLEYVYGDRWFIVEARGKILKDDDKFVASEMRLIKEIPVVKVVKWFAISCARSSLKYWNKKYPNDKRPLEAIEAAEDYLRKPTEENLKKLTAAESAAWSARSAAWSARSAARSAAWSAESAAWSAESAAKKSQNKILMKLIKEAIK
jgi:hypothetical protein